MAGTSEAGSSTPQRVAVLGAGTMGTAIAALAIGSGLPVLLHEVDERVRDAASATVTRQVRVARMMGALPASAPQGRLVVSGAIGDMAGSAAVIEAVPERVELKAKVLADVSSVIGQETLLASSTSAIPIDELADATAWPESFVGLHFMNPPYLIRTVEVVRGRRSSDAAMTAVTALLASMGSRGLLVGDGAGFVINRILQRMINEAARIAEEGRAAPEVIDALFTGCLGHRAGPLATADLIGLDNVVDSLDVLHRRTGDDGFRPCGLLLAKVHDGDLGRKSGRGFFEYPR